MAHQHIIVDSCIIAKIKDFLNSYILWPNQIVIYPFALPFPLPFDLLQVLGQFMARAVADDCLPPKYISSYKGSVEVDNVR